MRKIVLASIKDGVGKTVVSSSLARSLKRLGFRVGYLDADIPASTGSEAFGLDGPPDWKLDAAADGGRGAIVPHDVDGIQFITLASRFGQAPAVLWNEERKIDAARQLLQWVVAWADWHLIANYIIASLSSISFKLSELKRSGLVHNIKWSDGSKVWVLTPEGYRRLLPAPRQKAKSISSDRNGVMAYTRSTISKLIWPIPYS